MKTDLKNYNDKDFLEIKNILSKYTKRAYFVGGFVRDYFLGIISKDIDIEVYDISPFEFNEIMQKIGAIGTGKNYFVYKYKNYDISLPRIETKVGIGHKAFEVEICNDEKFASKRRDFTINSIMINIFDGKILDFYGGLNDLKNRILKVTNEKTFIEDSLRVLRGVGFVSRFNLKVDKKTFEIMKDIDLSDLSIDRINSELKKLFNAKYQELGLRLLFELNLIEFLFLTNLSEIECKKIELILKNSVVKNEMFFLYIFLNLLNLDKEKVLKRLNLNTVYKRLIKEPFYKKPSDFDLLYTALKMPLCSWLGIYNNELIKRAKNLNVYNKKFDTKISAQDVINDGFFGKYIAIELEKRQSAYIKEFLKCN